MLKRTWKIYKEAEGLLFPLIEATVPADTSDDEIMRKSWDWLQEHVSKEDRAKCHLEIEEPEE
jgi:hypothetical protein